MWVRERSGDRPGYLPWSKQDRLGGSLSSHGGTTCNDDRLWYGRRRNRARLAIARAAAEWTLYGRLRSRLAQRRSRVYARESVNALRTPNGAPAASSLTRTAKSLNGQGRESGSTRSGCASIHAASRSITASSGNGKEKRSVWITMTSRESKQIQCARKHALVLR